MTRLSTAEWRRVVEIFERALDEPAASRRELVRRACGGDSALEAALERLLHLDERAAARPGSIPKESRDRGSAGGEPERPPRQVGRYRVLGEIGRGGTSRVYLGVRREADFEQRVALKVLSKGWSAAARRRLARERSTLARLEHPHIARFIDGEVTADGRPVVVQEYVEGVPFLEYLDARRLGLRRRLELFLQVCSAVRYAHRKLVVHRDLKPGNLRVTDEGVPKVLDFGLAKPVEAQPGEETPCEERLLTPAYASPEQLLGGEVDGRSDLFSLGAVLYEVLTGCRAFPAAPSPLAALEQRRRGSAPPSTAFHRSAPSPQRSSAAFRAASRASTPGRLRRRLAGDLDAIVLACLRFETAERYPSVDALMADIDSYLTGHPVRARAGGPGYRARKLLARHRWAVVAGLAILLALLVLVLRVD